MKNRWEWGLLILIFIFAYFLRVMFLPQKTLTFGYDQARDAFVTRQIIDGDLKILGPPASTPGLYHGVFYYYYLVPPYLLGANPINAAYWNALFNAAIVFVVFCLAYLMTKNKLAGFLAAFLFAISFEATQYATWLSNPTLGVWTVPLIYLGLWAWVSNKKNWGAIVAAIGLGLSIQSDIFLAYHFVPLLLWLWVARSNIKRKQLIVFGLSLIATLSTMILVEFKFGFKSITGIQKLAMSQQPSLAYADSLGDYLILYLNQIGRIFAFNSYPGNIGYGGVFIIFLALYRVFKSKKYFLASWLFSHITVVTVGGTSTPFLMVGIGPAVSIIVAIFISKWWQKGYKLLAVFILGVLVFGNITVILKENPRGSTLFAIQRDMFLSKQIAAIDYVYQSAEGEEFSINTLTSPMWINNVWAYLFDWYGEAKYAYKPQWHGRDQVGQLADGVLPDVDDSTQQYYLILEPMGGIPARYLEEMVEEENLDSEIVEEKYFGELRIQKRVRKD